MKKNMLWIAAAAACVIALSGCGADKTGEAEGTFTLPANASTAVSSDAAAAGTSDTTAAQGAAQSDAAGTQASGTTDAQIAVSDAQTAVSDAQTAVSDAQAAVSDAAATTADTAANPAAGADMPAPDQAFAEKAKVIYNGVTFGVHDSFAAISAQLGNETRPTFTAKPCIPGAGSYVCHHYPGFSVAVSETSGIIYQIFLTESEDPGRDICTTGGLHLGQTMDDAVRILGPSQSPYDFMYTQDDPQNPDFGISANFADNGEINSIEISDYHVLID